QQRWHVVEVIRVEPPKAFNDAFCSPPKLSNIHWRLEKRFAVTNGCFAFGPKNGVIGADNASLFGPRKNAEVRFQAIGHPIVLLHEFATRVALRLKALAAETLARHKTVHLTH